MTTGDLLAHELDALIGGVPGVSALYSATPMPERVLATVGKLITRLPTDIARTRVVEIETGTTIHIHIGVQDTTPAPDVCRNVYNAVEDHLHTAPRTTPVIIQVKVGRIG